MAPDLSAGLWLTVIAFGAYHGLNPAMGWPLAVANGLTARRGSAVFTTVLPLSAGHLLAMCTVLVPFAMLAWLVEWSRGVRIAAGVAVMLFGAYRLLQRRHPRMLVRVRPTQLTLWSFLMATAHGAGLMLLPITLSLCAQPPPSTGIGAGSALAFGHATVMSLMASGIAMALTVALVHTCAMLTAGLTIAWGVYRWLGLRFLKQSWLNLDAAWAASLVLTGGVACAIAVGS